MYNSCTHLSTKCFTEKWETPMQGKKVRRLQHSQAAVMNSAACFDSALVVKPSFCPQRGEFCLPLPTGVAGEMTGSSVCGAGCAVLSRAHIAVLCSHTSRHEIKDSAPVSGSCVASPACPQVFCGVSSFWQFCLTLRVWNSYVCISEGEHTPPLCSAVSINGI